MLRSAKKVEPKRDFEKTKRVVVFVKDGGGVVEVDDEGEDLVVEGEGSFDGGDECDGSGGSEGGEEGPQLW